VPNFQEGEGKEDQDETSNNINNEKESKEDQKQEEVQPTPPSKEDVQQDDNDDDSKPRDHRKRGGVRFSDEKEDKEEEEEPQRKKRVGGVRFADEPDLDQDSSKPTSRGVRFADEPSDSVTTTSPAPSKSNPNAPVPPPLPLPKKGGGVKFGKQQPPSPSANSSQPTQLVTVVEIEMLNEEDEDYNSLLNLVLLASMHNHLTPLHFLLLTSHSMLTNHFYEKYESEKLKGDSTLLYGSPISSPLIGLLFDTLTHLTYKCFILSFPMSVVRGSGEASEETKEEGEEPTIVHERRLFSHSFQLISDLNTLSSLFLDGYHLLKSTTSVDENEEREGAFQSDRYMAAQELITISPLLSLLHIQFHLSSSPVLPDLQELPFVSSTIQNTPDSAKIPTPLSSNEITTKIEDGIIKRGKLSHLELLVNSYICLLLAYHISSLFLGKFHEVSTNLKNKLGYVSKKLR